MTDALEDHEGTVSSGGRTITNVCFADYIDGLAEEEEELANLVEHIDICVVIAEGSTNALSVSKSILAHFCIPVSLHNKNALLRCLINDILWLVIEFFYFVVVIV